jgi:pSer/pThr/pTyr-binding forkhead associated (FHA) protein
MIRRLVVSGGSHLMELPLKGTVIVGRDPACDVSEATDPLLSRRHAEFVAVGRDVVVRDLGSRNGILVNGSKTPQSVLHAGDVVQIGHLQVQLFEDAGLLLDTADETIAATRTARIEDDATFVNDRASVAATVLVDAGSNDATIVRDKGSELQPTIVGSASALVAPSFNDDDDETSLPLKRVGS